MDRHALGDALGWPSSRWKNLEAGPAWGEDSRAWVREGLLALVARTTLPEEAGQKVVRFVMGESRALPWNSPPTWLEGKAPVPRPVGRPPQRKTFAEAMANEEAARAASGARFSVDPLQRALRPVQRPVLPESVWRAQLDVILAALVSGEIDAATAADEIEGIHASLRAYYNKTPGQGYA